MWFKNLIIYRIDESIALDPELLEESLAKNRFNHCGTQEAVSLGWVPPMGRTSELLTHNGNGCTLLSAKREERLLPASVIREAVNEKAEEIEIRDDRRVGRKERQELKEDTIFEMMPRAFTRSGIISGLVMADLGLLVIDTASRSRAEQWLGLLRETLGSLRVSPISVKTSIVHTLTAWLSKSAAAPGLAIEDQCELRSPGEDGAVIRCSKQDLSVDEVQSHLDAGKLAFKLALNWDETLTFVVTDNFEIKRLRFGDQLIEQASQDGSADAAAEFDASYTLMCLELSRFFPALFNHFGGLVDKDG